MTAEPKRKYAADFLEESLGLARGDVDPTAVPTEFVLAVADAMAGSERSAVQEPELERLVWEAGDDIVRSVQDSRGFVLWKERWPRAAKFAACLTHDVDTISRPRSEVLQRRDRFSTADLLLAMLGLRSLYDNTSEVAKLESARKLHSSFYLLSAAYDIAGRREELNSLLRDGWDIGLQGDFGTHDSLERMVGAKTRFQQATGIDPKGVREHYLRFEFATTWGLMERAGFKYDTTVGNTDRLGFRAGLCTPFHPPDEDWRARKILELPLVLMDATLWGYLRRTEQEGLADFEALKGRVSEVQGLFTLLWHPESLKMKGGRIYSSLLDILLKDGCFIGSGLEVAEWWLKRSAPLVFDGKSFKMEAAPAELVMRFKAKAGQAPRVEGGTVGLEGGAVVIKAAGGPLQVTVV